MERSAYLHAVPSQSRENGSRTDKSAYSEKQSQRVYLALYKSSPYQSTSLVMVDPAHKWERKPQSPESLTLLSNMSGTVRHNALAKLHIGNKDKNRDLYGEQVLQVKNLLAARLMQDYLDVDVNNGKLNFVHLKSPLVVNLNDGHRVFIDFPAKTKIRARRPSSAHEFDPTNPKHSLIEVLIHNDKITTIDTTWNLGESSTGAELRDFVAEFVKKAVSLPLETCRKEFRGRTLGKPTVAAVNPTPKTEGKDRIVELGSINLDNPSPEDLEKLAKLKLVMGFTDSKESSSLKKPVRLSREDFLAKKAEEKQKLWESTELFSKFHGTPLGKIAERPNRFHSYDEADKEMKDRNHDRGILAHTEHWHTLAIRALHDLQYKNGELIDIDEVLEFISEGLAEVDPKAEEIKVGDNYQTRFFSVLAFYNANARELGLDIHYTPASLQKIVKGRKTEANGYHFTVAPSMGDDQVVVDLIAKGNYNK